MALHTAQPARNLTAHHLPAALRVVHFSDTYLPRRDGIVTSLRTLADALTTAGHDCLTVVPRHPDQGEQANLLRLGAVPCGFAELRVLPWPAVRHVRRIAAWRPDIVHVHSPGPAGLLGVLTARRLGVPVVHTYHTDLHAYADAYRVPASVLRAGLGLYARRLGEAKPALPPQRAPRHAALDATNVLMLRDADAVVVPTPAVLSRACLPVPASRLFLVPAGVEKPAVPPGAAGAFRARYGIAATDRVVLFVGRVNREKGIDLLLPAFARAAAAHPDARLVLVGAIYERRWLRDLIDHSGLSDRVVLTGQLDAAQVAAAYAGAEVFAFPSRTDTQGLVLQEAALAGVPSVLADPGLHRTGTLGDAPVLAQPTPAAYGDAVAGLLADPVAARAAGENARLRALRHTPQRYGAAMLDVYRHVLTGRVPGAGASCE